MSSRLDSTTQQSLVLAAGGAPTLPGLQGGHPSDPVWAIPGSCHGVTSLSPPQWEAFSLPELQNFLRILDKEEDEQLQSLTRRYAAYRQKLEDALAAVWKPG